MAIIGKIREKSILLVIIIGLALLAFILSDYKNMFGVNEGEYGIGHVFGEKVDQVKYNTLYQKLNNQFSRNPQVRRDEIDKMASQQAWSQLIDSVIMEREYDALGIIASDKEINSYLMATDGFDVVSDPSQISQNIRSFFIDSISKQVTPQSTIEGRQKLKIQLDQIKKNKKDWEGIKNYYVSVRKREKYFDLISQGIYTTSIEAEDDYKAKNTKKSIRYIFKPSSSVSDEDIKYNESDLAKYYAEHKFDPQYQNEKSFKVVKFFSVSDAPSQSDSTNFFNEFEEFEQGLKDDENDTIYANKKSQIPLSFFNGRSTLVPENHFKAEDLFTYPPSMDTAFNNAQVGDIVGPYACGNKMKTKSNGLNYYALSKVIGKTPSRIKARHLLINVANGQDSSAVKQQAETYVTQLSNSQNRDETFNSLKLNSIDPVGEYDNLTELFLHYTEENRTLFFGDDIAEFCMNSPVGSVKLIETPMGYHVVELLERDQASLPKVATIYKEFRPSEETMSLKGIEADQLLSRLYQKNRALKSPEDVRNHFDSIVQSAGYQVRAAQIEDNAPEVPSSYFKSASPGDRLVKMAYKSGAKVGTLVGRPIRDKDTYVIGMVYLVRVKGTPRYNEIKSDIKKAFIKEKKNQVLMAELKGKSLEDLSANETAKPAEVSFNNMNNIDAQTIGALFSANSPKENVTLQPLKSSNGVYLIAVDKTLEATAKKTFKVEKEELNKNWILQMVKNPMSYNQNRKISESSYLINGLYKRANVIDNRKLLQLGIRN
jgi:peptidyl-prolyl cis-trans isomerase D